MSTATNKHSAAPRVLPTDSQNWPAIRLGIVTAFLLAATVLGAALRFARLGAKSLWFDEALTALMASVPSHAFLQRLWRGGEGNMALYYMLMRGWTHFGTSEWILRSFSALAGMAAIPAFYLLGKRLFGTRVGLIAALLLSVNAGHVAYSQEARSYSLLFLLAIVSSLLLVRAIESGSTFDYVAYGVTSGVVVYCHFFAFLLIGSQVLSLLALPRNQIRWGKFLAAAALLAVLASPALVFIFSGNSGQLSWVPKPGLRDVQRFGYFLVADGGTLKRPLLVAYVLIAGLSVLVFLDSWAEKRRSLSNWKYVFQISWLLIPPAAALLVSVWKPVFMPRFLIFCIAPLLLLAALGLSQVRAGWLRNALTVGLFLASLAPVVWYYGDPKEDWRGAATYVASQAQRGDAVVLYGGYVQVPFEYYRQRIGWPASVPIISLSDVPQSARMPELQSPGRVWLILHGHPNDAAALKLERYLAADYSGQHSEERYYMVTVQLYCNPSATQIR